MPFFMKPWQNSWPKGKSSFRTSEALHRLVFRAKRDPGSSPAIGGIQAILDSRSPLSLGQALQKDGTGDFGKRRLGLQNSRENPRMQDSGSFLRLRDHAVNEADQAALHFFSESWATLLGKRQQTFLPVRVSGATFQARPLPLQLGLKGGME